MKTISEDWWKQNLIWIKHPIILDTRCQWNAQQHYKVESVEAKINMEVLSRLNIFGIMMYLAVQRYLIVIHKWKFRGHSFLWYIHENCDGFGVVDTCDLCFKPVSETTILENVLTFQDQNFSRDTCSALFSSLSLAHPSELISLVA